MKRLFLTILICLITTTYAQATVMQGGISQSQTITNTHKVIDKTTKLPIPNAKITIPSQNYTTYSNQKGEFQLKNPVYQPTFLSVEKQNYKPFSVTISKNNTQSPMMLSIEKSNTFDIKIDSDLCHLGDNNFSGYSANAGEFKGRAIGPVYKKNFYISRNNLTRQNYLVIGSIIGVDTAIARGMGQNKISNSFASPPSVYLNGVKIAEIKVNGDNQKIKLPSNLIRWNQNNEITIKAGINLMQTAYIDYDDFEFMNVSVQVF